MYLRVNTVVPPLCPSSKVFIALPPRAFVVQAWAGQQQRVGGMGSHQTVVWITVPISDARALCCMHPASNCLIMKQNKKKSKTQEKEATRFFLIRFQW